MDNHYVVDYSLLISARVQTILCLTINQDNYSILFDIAKNASRKNLRPQ